MPKTVSRNQDLSLVEGRDIGARIPSGMAGCPSSFEHALSSEYGPHSVVPGSSRCSARLDGAQFGPFGVGIAIGQSVAWHRSGAALAEKWHNDFFVIQQHRGSSTIRHGGRTTNMKPYDLMLVDSVGECSFEFAKMGSLIAFSISKRALNGDEKNLKPLIGSRIDGSRGYGRVLSSALFSLSQPGAEFDEVDEAILSEIFVTMLARYQSASTMNRDHKRLPPKLEELQDWVIENIAETGITPETLAKRSALSRRQLYRLFQETGTTPQKWVWDLRLRVAHERLNRHSKWSITEVAFSVGFSDAAHFSRAFRNKYGSSPSLRREPG